jgi:hypothetical protein
MAGTRRFTIDRRKNQEATVTQQALDLFRQLTQMEGEGKFNTPEFNKLDTDLSRSLGLKPWHPTIFEVFDESEILDVRDIHHRANARKVLNLKKQLEQLL